MSYKIAGIDVHKAMLAVAVADVAGEGEYVFKRRRFGTTPEQLKQLAEWLVEEDAQEGVMEATAQYWKPVWEALERYWQKVQREQVDAPASAGTLYLAQAQSNRGPRGRKNDFADAERLVKRLVAQELRLSFVPDPEQRLWRTVSRKKHQLRRQKVRLHNQLECLLEEGHIKLSSVISDLLGVSGQRILKALASGEQDPATLAALADPSVQATPKQLREALSASSELSDVYRRVLKMHLEEVDLVEQQIEQLQEELGKLLEPYQAAVQRLAEVPGLGVDSAQQIIAEVGPLASVFPSAKHLASWVGVCPGQEESAQISRSSRSPKGNRNLRRLLSQAAHSAVKAKGSIFQKIFQRLLRYMPYSAAIWAIAHRICRLIWKILHQQVQYRELGTAPNPQAQRRRFAKMIRELRRSGYRVQLPSQQQVTA